MRLFSTESNTMLFVFVKSTMADGAMEFVVQLGSMVRNFPGWPMERNIVSIVINWRVSVVFTLILVVRVLIMMSISMVTTMPSVMIEVNIVEIFVSNAVFFTMAAVMRFYWISFVLICDLLFRRFLIFLDSSPFYLSLFLSLRSFGSLISSELLLLLSSLSSEFLLLLSSVSSCVLQILSVLNSLISEIFSIFSSFGSELLSCVLQGSFPCLWITFEFASFSLFLSFEVLFVFLFIGSESLFISLSIFFEFFLNLTLALLNE
jgi:hypothetical protein